MSLLRKAIASRKDTARAPRYGALLDPLRKELGLPPFVTPSQ